MNFKAFSQEDLELITLRLVLLGDVNNIKLFSYSISKEKRIEILKSLITSQPPTIYSPTKLVPSPLNVKWVASRLLLLEGYKDFPSVNFLNLGFIEFANMTDAITQFFKFSLSRVENRPSEESKIISFADSFLQYYSKRITVADFLLTTYTDYIIQVPIAKLFRSFQFRCFLLLNNLDKIDLNELDANFSNFNDYQPFRDLYQIHRGYQKEDFFPTIQKMIINDKLFPSTIGNDSDKMVRSLIDTTLIKKQHFVEILREHSYVLYKEGKIDESIEKAKLIKGIESWIFISHYYTSIKELSPESIPVPIEDSVHYFQNLNYDQFESSTFSVASDFLNRLQNDNSFFSMIRQNTGQTINSSMLYDHSIPFFLILFLKLADPLPFKDLNDVHLFCVNDEDRLVDADFVWSYFAEVVAINALTKPEEAEDMIAQSGWYLSQINHSKTHHDVLIDIFSIMFLQTEIECSENRQKKSKYVCYQSVAEIILTMILGMSDDDPTLMQYAQDGHLLIQFARSISNGVDFEDLIFPKEQQLLKAFQNEDWLIADHIASLNAHLSDMNILYKTVNGYLKKSKFNDFVRSANKNLASFVDSPFDPSKSKSKLASVEIGLSFPDQLDALKAALDVSPISPEPLELTDRRYKKLLKKKNVNNFIGLLRAVKTLNEPECSLINQNFSNLNSSKWIPSPFSERTEDEGKEESLHLLKSFLFYLDSLVGVVLNDERLVDSIDDALKEDPSSFVNKLFNKGSIQNAEKVSKLIKQDMMLMLASEKSVSDEVINQLVNENLPFALTLALFKENGIKENPISEQNSVAFKIANIALQSNSNREKQTEIIFGKEVKPETEASIENKLNELKEIFENNFDIEKVVDISYSLDEEAFSGFVLNYINAGNDCLVKIIEIVNRCGSINSKLYDSAMFLKKFYDSKVEIYPFENLFVHLLNTKNYREASKFLQLFDGKIDHYIDHLVNEYIKEMRQNKSRFNSCSKYEILNISPKNKEEIESKAAIQINSIFSNENSIENDELNEETVYEIEDFSSLKEQVTHNPQIDLDDEICQALLYESENDIFTFCVDFRKSVHLVKDLNRVVDLALRVFENVISQIEVNSVEIECEAWQFFDKVESIIERYVISSNSLNEQLRSDASSFTKKISLYKTIVDHSPFKLCQFEYDFFNCGRNLSFIFSKIDIVDSLANYCTAFDIPKDGYILDSYIFDCCKLGITDFQVPFKIENSRYKNSIENDRRYYCSWKLYEDISLLLTPKQYFFEPLLMLAFINQFPPTDDMVNLLGQIEDHSDQHKKTVNRSSSIVIQFNEREKCASTSNSMPSLLFSDDMSADHFFRRIQMISNKESNSIFEIEPMKKVKEFFKENAPIDIVISYFTLKGDLSTAISLLEESGNKYDKKCQQELFKSSFFEKIISRTDDIKMVLKNVVTIDKELLKSVLPESCPYLRFDVYSFMKEWRLAYEAATDLFCIPAADSNEARLRALNLLTWMENCLDKITEQSDDKEIEKIIVALQKEVCHFAIDHNLVLNFSEANFFQGDTQKETVVIFLMTHFNIKLAIAALRFFELNRFRIGERSCDIFFNEDMKNIDLFFKKFQKEIDKEIFIEIFYAICTRMKYVHEVDQEVILAYINIVENKEFKRKLLYQFGFLKEASDMAFAEGDVELISLIANDAYLLQKTSLLSKCLKFIEKKSQAK